MKSLRSLLFIGLCMLMACASESDSSNTEDDALRERAEELAQQYLIVDGHVDIPYRLTEKMEDISTALEARNARL